MFYLCFSANPMVYYQSPLRHLGTAPNPSLCPSKDTYGNLRIVNPPSPSFWSQCRTMKPNHGKYRQGRLPGTNLRPPLEQVCSTRGNANPVVGADASVGTVALVQQDNENAFETQIEGVCMTFEPLLESFGDSAYALLLVST